MSIVVLSCAFFSLGLYGVLTRRDLVALLASAEVMLGGATLLLVTLMTERVGASAGALEAARGSAVAVVLLAIVAAEAAVGLAIVIAVFRTRGTLNVDEVTLLKN